MTNYEKWKWFASRLSREDRITLAKACVQAEQDQRMCKPYAANRALNAIDAAANTVTGE